MVDVKSDTPKQDGDTFQASADVEAGAERSRSSVPMDAPPAKTPPDRNINVEFITDVAHRRKRPKVRRAPLAWLTTLGARVLTPAAYQMFVENRVVSAYDEYYPALAKGHTKHCVWILTRCVLLVIYDLTKELLWLIRRLFAPRDDE